MKAFIQRFKFLFKIHRSIPFLIDFYRSKEVKLKVKLLFLFFIIGYIILPLDVIPDFIAIFGITDDITIVILLLQLMIKVSPNTLKEKYKKFI